ncbi:MAG: aspartate aminotransferase family protein, partial [Bryobacteraceae bacterium]
IYETLEKRAAELISDLPSGVTANRAGSMFTLFFQGGPVRNYEEAKRCDTSRFSRFFHHLLDRGVWFPPSQFEAVFLSAAHTPQDIAYTKNAMARFFAENATA